MNDMRKLMEAVGNTYADAASKHIDGLAKVIADYLATVTDDPYVFSDISEFSGGALDARVTELLQAGARGIEEASTEDRSAPHNLNPREYDAFAAGFELGNDTQYEMGGMDPAELPSAFKTWIDGGRKGMYEDINRTHVTYNEEDIKKAYLAGYQDGERAGNTPTGMMGTEETPEESYQYWLKYDRGDE